MPHGVPFLFVFSEIGTLAVNLGGSGGQSPLAATCGVRGIGLSFVVCVCLASSSGRNRGPGLRVRSQSFLSCGAATDASVCPLPHPAAPHTHPFVNSTAESTAVVRNS